MTDDINKKIYKYGNEFLSFEEVYKIYQRLSIDRKRKFKDCLAHFILAQIFRKCGFVKDANTIESIAVLEKKLIEENPSKIQMFIYNKEYLMKMNVFFGLNGIRNKYKINEFINGDWLLNKLVSLTLGSTYYKDEYEDFSLINYEFFEENECLAIAENFKRNMRNEELVYYRSPKKLKK